MYKRRLRADNSRRAVGRRIQREKSIARVLQQHGAGAPRQTYVDTEEDGVRNAPDRLRTQDMLYGLAGRQSGALYNQSAYYQDPEMEKIGIVVGSRRVRRRRQRGPRLPRLHVCDHGNSRQQLQELDLWFWTDADGNERLASEGLNLNTKAQAIRKRFEDIILEIGQGNERGWTFKVDGEQPMPSEPKASVNTVAALPSIESTLSEEEPEEDEDVIDAEVTPTPYTEATVVTIEDDGPSAAFLALSQHLDSTMTVEQLETSLKDKGVALKSNWLKADLVAALAKSMTEQVS